MPGTAVGQLKQSGKQSLHKAGDESKLGTMLVARYQQHELVAHRVSAFPLGMAVDFVWPAGSACDDFIQS